MQLEVVPKHDSLKNNPDERQNVTAPIAKKAELKRVALIDDFF